MPISKTVRPGASQLFRSPYFWLVVVRLAVFLAVSPIRFKGDAADYEVIAANLSLGNGFSRCPMEPFPPTAQRPPLFSFLLSGLYALGADHLWASFVLNLGFDAVSLALGRRWAQEAGFNPAYSRIFTWILVFCPILIAYCPYPTTENLSILLFLGALLLTFRIGRKGTRAGRTGELVSVAGAGLFWGLLSLCRSYFLLFPAVLVGFRLAPRMKRQTLAVLAALSLAAPSVWVARNYAVFGKLAFSQGAAVGWQSYQGLCYTNFDWWDQQDVDSVYAHPLLSQMVQASCATDERMGELDREVRDEVLRECVAERPFDAAFNTAVKGVMLFINWGQLLPYTRVPVAIRWPVNAFMLYLWWCIAVTGLRRRRAKSAIDPAAPRLALIGIAYVVAVTLPFAVDARYLLAPALVALLVSLEAAGGFRGLMRSGLPWAWSPSRRGSRTP
jgi:hypothetical protein